jgi:hypothetical protein
MSKEDEEESLASSSFSTPNWISKDDVIMVLFWFVM